ncbi:MAG: SPOR domain-containing protein [Steroidobacterales bacterium]
MKERLTGAIILVALIVLLVPALLRGPIRSLPHPIAAAASTSSDEPPLRSYTIHLADDAHAHASTPASGPEQPAPVGPPVDTTPAQAAPTPAPPASTTHMPPPAAAAAPAPAPAGPVARVPAPAPAPAKAAAAQSGAWMVQLGSFASRANAERLAQQLRARGFQAGVSQGSSGRRLFRVRAGPAPTRAAAEQLAAKLSAAGHKGEIVPK